MSDDTQKARPIETRVYQDQFSRGYNVSAFIDDHNFYRAVSEGVLDWAMDAIATRIAEEFMKVHGAEIVVRLHLWDLEVERRSGPRREGYDDESGLPF